MSVTLPAMPTNGGDSTSAASPSGRSKTRKAIATTFSADRVKPFQGTRRCSLRLAS